MLMSDIYERNHAINLRKAYKKIRKPVRWNNQEFESARALGRHLKLANHDSVSGYIKRKLKLKDFIPEYIIE